MRKCPECGCLTLEFDVFTRRDRCTRRVCGYVGDVQYSYTQRGNHACAAIMGAALLSTIGLRTENRAG
ncbi:MAG: hypothetical protein KBI47_10805 [Armatimonadetes bacterium]|nr:hypothetical protein [Armatimonadota bacterium]